jgi:hypothetical protein
MSSAELQALMSQLQAQRQDAYSHATTSDALTYNDSIDQKFWLPDGTEGERPDGKAGEHPHAMMPLSVYELHYFDKDKQIPFTRWKHDPTNNSNGTINYTACDMDDMALMIAWEKMWKNKFKKQVADLKNQMTHLKEKSKETQHGKATGKTIVTNNPDGSITISTGPANGTNNAQQPNKKKRKPRGERPAPQEDIQRAKFNKVEDQRAKRWDTDYPMRKGEYEKRDFKNFFRTPGTIKSKK